MTLIAVEGDDLVDDVGVECGVAGTRLAAHPRPVRTLKMPQAVPHLGHGSPQRLMEELQVPYELVRLELCMVRLLEAIEEEDLLRFGAHDLRVQSQIGMQPRRTGALRTDDEKVRKVRQVHSARGYLHVLQAGADLGGQVSHGNRQQRRCMTFRRALFKCSPCVPHRRRHVLRRTVRLASVAADPTAEPGPPSAA